MTHTHTEREKEAGAMRFKDQAMHSYEVPYRNEQNLNPNNIEQTCISFVVVVVIVQIRELHP